MIKNAASKLLGGILNDSVRFVVGCSYSIALILGTVFIILWILGWKKGIKASMLTLVAYAVMVIFGGLV